MCYTTRCSLPDCVPLDHDTLEIPDASITASALEDVMLSRAGVASRMYVFRMLRIMLDSSNERRSFQPLVLGLCLHAAILLLGDGTLPLVTCPVNAPLYRSFVYATDVYGLDRFCRQSSNCAETPLTSKFPNQGMLPRQCRHFPFSAHRFRFEASSNVPNRRTSRLRGRVLLWL